MSAARSNGGFALDWGKAVHYPDCQVVTLYWQEFKIEVRSDITEAFNVAKGTDDSTRTGVYALEGCRDGAPGREILYIGHSDGEDGPAGEKVAGRLARSLTRLRAQGVCRSHLFGNIWEMTALFAFLGFQDIPAVEALLLHAHTPPFNARPPRDHLPAEQNYLVLNAGQKGALLPVSASVYYHMKCWPSLPQSP